MNWVEDVFDFQRRFGHPIPPTPSFPDEGALLHRAELLGEELRELGEAIDRRDLVETADAIGDCIYVLLGTAWACGIDMRRVWDEVHRTNMTKERGAGKAVKPDGWQPPDIAGVLRAQGWGGASSE